MEVIKPNPMTEIQHLRILKDRIDSLKNMLSGAINQRDDLDWELEQAKVRWESFRGEIIQRRTEMEERYEKELKEYGKQIKLAKEMLEKKKDEHLALMNYVEESKICERSIDDLKNFDWSSLNKLVLGTHERLEQIEEHREKALVMVELNQKARSCNNDMLDLLAETLNDKAILHNKLGELKGYVEDWRQLRETQQKMIIKMKSENERLNLLVKQCCVTNEPVSEFITKNVRAKCNSFLSSGSSDELLSGLLKYKQRQDKTIKLLRHKENKLARDTSLLQIASDQTADQMQYYLNIVQDNVDLQRTFIPFDECS